MEIELRNSRWTTGLAAIVAAAAAFAADLPSAKAQPPAPSAPVFSWTGFYLSADVGGGWTRDKTVVVPGSPPLDIVYLNGSGAVVGPRVGYAMQFDGGLVIGAEADFEAGSIAAKTDKFTDYDPFSGYPPGTVVSGEAESRETIPRQGSLRARLGYAVGNALVYGTGGLAVARIDTRYSWLNGDPDVDSFSRSRAGWTLGAGFEYALDRNWSVRGEYRYTKFNGFTDPLRNSPLGLDCCNPAVHDPVESAIRFGVAYKINP